MDRLDADERAAVVEQGCPECGGETVEEDLGPTRPGGMWRLSCRDCDWAAWAPERDRSDG